MCRCRFRLTTLSLNTVYKGNNGSAMTATTIVESSITNQVSIGDPLLENHYQSNSPTSPTCVFTTGGGTTPSCAAAAGSSDSGGLINLTAGRARRSLHGGGQPAANWILERTRHDHVWFRIHNILDF